MNIMQNKRYWIGTIVISVDVNVKWEGASVRTHVLFNGLDMDAVFRDKHLSD